MFANRVRTIGAVATLLSTLGIFIFACDDTNPPAKPSVKTGANAGMATRGGGPMSQMPPGDGKPGNGSTLGNVIASKQSITAPATGDPCGGVPDGAAWCASNTKLGFCSGGASFTIDCNAYGSGDTQWSFDKGGFCYETPTQMDCLLCFSGAGGATTCCDSALTFCCDESGACFLPAPG